MEKEPIVKIKNISKSYIISHRAPYITIRDKITELAKKPFQIISGNIQKDTKEKFWALKDITFNINKGERIGIIGKNGAGKSTLLKILSQITYPDTGKIELNGRVASLLEVGTGFHPELSGRENIFLNGAILGMKRVEICKKFDEIVAFSEIENFLDTPVKRYSSGMFVRLAFAVAAHLEPEVLIVDEVLAVGDVQFQKKCLGKMQDVAKTGRTIIFVSHNMNTVQRLCSRCILLDKGKLITDGKTNQVIEQYISTSASKVSVFKQDHNPNKPINLRYVGLQNENGQPASEFRYDKPINIKIQYEVNESISSSSVWIGLRTREDTIVFGTADTDTTPQLLKSRKPGLYQTKINLPEKWLNAGRYYLVVGIVKSIANENFDRVESASFTVLEVGTPVTGRPGLLQPYIHWDTKKIN